ncbi:MAG: 23S rRNA (adenine(2503)-C(2))-methyltransferase RlmN [Candidatus Eremiobacteraeota bacterium]|nr:23S rRNA (adenine(2503)-C(2))-methyltransferase RlmN [Candidatus Eremiobacteraeota bacterium]MBV9647392.1 23S rRNA (adenine(2503)-C(2))-methyltransferase RlmN [Candidatus Eremiobacteraeota bacterium]
MVSAATDSAPTSAQSIWLEEKLRRAGFGDVDAFLRAYGVRTYRTNQLYRAVTRELVDDVEAISVLPHEIRQRLVEDGFELESLWPVVLQRSGDGQTTKGLFRLGDGAEVEAVLMEHYGERTTVCISSQAGCAYQCAFCATGQGGFTRNLEAIEIFDQARYFARELKSRGKKITNIVFMGQGEPLANADAVMGAVALLTDPHGFALGHRHITISTVGLVPEIDRFAERYGQVNLAISLHAPTDVQRSVLMPVNRRYPLEALIAATDRYIARTRRKVFIEYVMLAGVNDNEETARALAALLRGRLYHVNLIPYNQTPDASFAGTAEGRIRSFQKILESHHIPTTVRVPMGRDIAAACGQLQAETQPKAHGSR